MRALGVLVGNGFRRWSTYRLATAAGAFTNTVFGVIRASVMSATVGAAGGTLAGYDAKAGLTYAWLVQALIAPVNMGWWHYFADRVRSGDVAVDLARPIDPQLAYLVDNLGRAAYTLIPRGAPPLLAGALLFGLAMPAQPLPYIVGALSVTLAVTISFAANWLINLTSFWLLDLRGVVTVYVLTASMLSGFTLPVHWFPDWLATIANVTPFPGMFQVPIDILMARVEGSAAVGLLIEQVAWLAALLAVGRAVFALGTRKLVVQGG